MEERIKKLEKEIEIIKARNFRVEGDKAWEVSWARKLSITVGTYFIAGIWLILIKENLPWLKALFPSAAYLISTLSLPFIKKWWIKKHSK